MKKSILLEVEIDLDGIIQGAENEEGAYTMLNYQLEWNRKNVREELQKKFDEVKVEFEKELNQTMRDKVEK